MPLRTAADTTSFKRTRPKILILCHKAALCLAAAFRRCMAAGRHQKAPPRLCLSQLDAPAAGLPSRFTPLYRTIALVHPVQKPFLDPWKLRKLRKHRQPMLHQPLYIDQLWSNPSVLAPTGGPKAHPPRFHRPRVASQSGGSRTALGAARVGEEGRGGRGEGGQCAPGA